jgi:hypothetical protein
MNKITEKKPAGSVIFQVKSAPRNIADREILIRQSIESQDLNGASWRTMGANALDRPIAIFWGNFIPLKVSDFPEP